MDATVESGGVVLSSEMREERQSGRVLSAVACINLSKKEGSSENGFERMEEVAVERSEGSLKAAHKHV